MPTDPQMKLVRQQINAVIEACAVEAEKCGPAGVRLLKVEESAELPPGRGVVISDDYARQLAKQAEERAQ